MCEHCSCPCIILHLCRTWETGLTRNRMSRFCCCLFGLINKNVFSYVQLQYLLNRSYLFLFRTFWKEKPKIKKNMRRKRQDWWNSQRFVSLQNVVKFQFIEKCACTLKRFSFLISQEKNNEILNYNNQVGFISVNINIINVKLLGDWFFSQSLKVN